MTVFDSATMQAVVERCGWMDILYGPMVSRFPHTTVRTLGREWLDDNDDVMAADGRLTLAGERVCIEVFALSIVPLDDGAKWAWLGRHGSTHDTLSEAIHAAVQECVK